MLGAVNLDTIADLYKYGYSGYGIGFDARLQSSRAEVAEVKLLLVLQLIIVPLCILIINKRIS